MIRKQLILLALAVASLLCSGNANAAQLRVEPVLLEMTAPAAAGVLKIHNAEDSEITVQTRVLRWSQTAGKETLEQTTDVVASPPAVKLAPGAETVVRVVRVSKQPVVGEESYRVIVDQLPNARRQQARAVNLLIRQSIPVFFRAKEVNPPSISWSLRSEAGKLVLIASNAGDERLRLASLRLSSAGATVSFGNGLVGYALGRSSMSWPVPKHPTGFGTVGPVSLTAETDKGPTHAVVHEPARR